MAKKRTPFHFSMFGVEIRIEDTEVRPGLMESVFALIDRIGGRTSPGAAVIPPASESVPAGKTVRKPRRLTRREREVARLIAAGLTNEQIGDRLVIAYETVRAHRASAFKKLGVHDATQLLEHPEAYEEPKG